MSLQRRFEGPDVRALLDEICAAYGTDPTIAKAETFRTGGVLGFFQREHYRLVVDETSVPRLPVAPATAPAPRAAAVQAEPELTAAEFFEGFEAAHQQAEAVCLGAKEADPFALVADSVTDHTVLIGSHRAAVPAPASADSLAVADQEPVTFEDILRRVASMVDAPDAEPVEWPRVDRRTGEEPAVGIASPAAARAADRILGALAELEALAEPGQLSTATAPTTAPATAPAVRPAGAAERPAPREPTRTEPEPEPELEPQSETAGRPGTGSRLRRRLLSAGLSPSTATRVVAATEQGAGLEAALLSAMESLPASPAAPRRPGSLVVVVGAPRPAALEAARLAGEVGADPSRIAFASDDPAAGPGAVIRSALEASSLAPRQRLDQTGIVAVAAPVGSWSAASGWARQVIDALEPTHVVAVCDAMYKNEDLADWIAALGGVDALAVDNVHATTSPAGILDLGLPVSRLGDLPATAARWAAAVLDRIGYGAAGDSEPRIDLAAAAHATGELAGWV